MTTDSGDTTPEDRAGTEGRPASERVETAEDPQSPYDIGLVVGEDETGPKPLDPELEDEQAEREG